MKRILLRGMVMATLMAAVGTGAMGTAVAGDSRTWSVYVHIEYPDGFVYENAFATGVPTRELPSILADCGVSHRFGSAVRYHCFPRPE